jgi:hypothetical protein
LAELYITGIRKPEFVREIMDPLILMHKKYSRPQVLLTLITFYFLVKAQGRYFTKQRQILIYRVLRK